MDLLIVLSWVGVFALAIGSLISLVIGGSLFTALFGILLTSLTISSIIPLNEKLRFMLGDGKLETIQRIGVVIGAIGSWILAGVGGWEFVPAGMVLSVAAVWWPVTKIIEMRKGRRSAVSPAATAMITSNEAGKDNFSPALPPPQYTATSTVKIETEDSNSLKTPTTCESKLQTPIFNV